MATAARIPMIATTISSSTNVKPSSRERTGRWAVACTFNLSDVPGQTSTVREEGRFGSRESFVVPYSPPPAYPGGVPNRPKWRCSVAVARLDSRPPAISRTDLAMATIAVALGRLPGLASVPMLLVLGLTFAGAYGGRYLRMLMDSNQGSGIGDQGSG